MTPEILNRKGARKIEDISGEVLTLLNQGNCETVNLTEWLAIDHVTLVEQTFPALGLGEIINEANQKIKGLKKPSAMACVQLMGSLIYERSLAGQSTLNYYKTLSAHTSDTIRCYAPYLVALDKTLSIEEKLDQSIELIADRHFGVREVVWMALRPTVDLYLDEAIAKLSQWSVHPDENIRRFTTEVTRPRGVWCKHIERLKQNPELALSILEPLKSDPSLYVQNSVGNWLNDASKTRPDFVIDLCKRWKGDSPSKETDKIIKRAMRTIDKK